jgi:NADH:ubiquinone oxidoreductase subunit 6 (subunit J)
MELEVGFVKNRTRLLTKTWQGLALFGCSLTFYFVVTPSVLVRAACVACLLLEVAMLLRATSTEESRDRRRFLLIQHFFMLGATLVLGALSYFLAFSAAG